MVKQQFNSSTLKAHYNPVTGKAQTTICSYTLVFGLSCWAAGQAPDQLIVEFEGVRRCCDDTLITELNTKHCLLWSQYWQTYFGCVEGVDIDGTDYNLIIAFGDGSTNTWSDIFVAVASSGCVWYQNTVGCIFKFNMAGIPCPPTARSNSLVIGNCGGTVNLGGYMRPVMGYGGSITPIDPSGQL